MLTGSFTHIRAVYVLFQESEDRFQAPSNVDSSVNSACKRIGFALRMIQTITAETMALETGQRVSFICSGDNYEKDVILPQKEASPCSAAVWCLRSKLTLDNAQNVSKEYLWNTIALELFKLFPQDIYSCKWLAILSCTHYKMVQPTDNTPFLHKEILSQTLGHCALGAGGLALYGSATMFTWPESLKDLMNCLTDTQLVDRRNFMDDSAYRGTYWANYVTSLGSILHELGHCFDLDHTPNGIMRRGGDDINFIIGFSNLDGSFESNSNKSNALISNKGTKSIETFNAKSQQLSIFQFSKMTFYESLLVEQSNIYQNNPLPGFWEYAPFGDHGNAFWGPEIATFLSFHRWFRQTPSCQHLQASDCIQLDQKLTIKAANAVKLVQFRLVKPCCSKNIESWNLTRRKNFLQLPKNRDHLSGCIIFQKCWNNRLPISVSFKNLIRYFTNQLDIDELKMVIVDSKGFVLQKLVNKSNIVNQ